MRWWKGVMVAGGVPLGVSGRRRAGSAASLLPVFHGEKVGEARMRGGKRRRTSFNVGFAFDCDRVGVTLVWGAWGQELSILARI